MLDQSSFNLRNRHFFAADIITFCLIPVFSFLIFDCKTLPINELQLPLILITSLFLTSKIFFLYRFELYQVYWRFAGIDELEQILKCFCYATLVQGLGFYILYYVPLAQVDLLPPILPFLDAILTFMLITGFRFFPGALERKIYRTQTSYKLERVLVVGAGKAGIAIVQQMQRTPKLGFYPVAFIDDDPAKLNLIIQRIPVFGDRYSISEAVKDLRIRKAIIAMPTVSGKIIREIVSICDLVGIQTLILPGIEQTINPNVPLNNVRQVKIEDLLRREPATIDFKKVAQLIKGKTILITGAGGSIGSELCRQVLKCQPKEIILIGHGENSLFNIQQELKQIIVNSSEFDTHKLIMNTFVADIRFKSRLDLAFQKFKPDLIFHAAAHKHVPMMELNPAEAITNNVMGTKNIVDLAIEHQVDHLVMISTDKAVNPSSIMGASKRVAEMLVLQASQKHHQMFKVVRFGNVLGSRGSVIPTFQKQIAAGGPVTVTHPEITRYFMTIPEAVQLTLQASVVGKGGEVITLNMGQPIKILDLAKELISLSGYEADKDIKVEFTGLRPGEKLHEEIFRTDEQYSPTEHDQLFVAKNASTLISPHLDILSVKLIEAATNNDSDLIFSLLKEIVPEYKAQYPDNR